MQDWDRLVESWKATLSAVEGVGGYTTIKSARSAGITHTKIWGLTIGSPASTADIERIETFLGMSLPPALSRFFLECACSVDFRWQLPEDFPAPQRFQEIFCGGFSLSLAALQEHALSMRTWIEQCFSDPHNAYDAVWHRKLAVIPIMNGDYIGIDLRAEHLGQVVYLSHDDGEGHGYVLGADIVDFLRRWTPLGCPGPEDWQWLPFASGKTSMLDPDGEAARAWRATLGLEIASG
jgi:cell wall assembly regulator SMI1